MIKMPPVIHVSHGAEDPPDRTRMRNPYFPFEHPADIMMYLFDGRARYRDARAVTEEQWLEYHDRALNDEEARVLDGMEEEWNRRLFPFDTPMDLLNFQIRELEQIGWYDYKQFGTTDEKIVGDIVDLWTYYKEEDLTEVQQQELYDRISSQDKSQDFPEDFVFPRPVDLLRNMLDSGEMEYEVDKKFYDPQLTTHGEKESRITATFSVDEKDKFDIAQKMWMHRRHRHWTEEEAQDCVELMIERGLHTPPAPQPEPLPEQEVRQGEAFQDEEREQTEITIERMERAKIKQTAKDVYDGESNIWFSPNEVDGIGMLFLSMVKVTNPESIGAIIGSGKLGGTVISHNGGPKRASCSRFNFLHRDDVRTFVDDFNAIVEFMSGFEDPTPRGFPEGEEPWEEITMTIKNKEEDDDDK